MSSQQKVDSLRSARNFVANVCKWTSRILIFGKHDSDNNCFLYEYNKYKKSLGYKKISEGTLKDIFFGYRRNFLEDEAKIYVNFLFRVVKENCKTDKENTLLRLRPYLKDVLDMHKNETDDNDQSFDVDSYLDRLYGVSNSEKKRKSGENFFIIKDRDVTEEDIKKALKLDNKYYHNHIDDSEQFSLEQCLCWNKKNNHRIYTMLKDTEGDILGYINAAPINDKCYSDIKDGKYPDADIDCDCIVKYTIPGKYNLYFASIVIDEDKQGGKNFFIQLFNGFLDKLITLANEEDIVISRIIADAVTTEGKEICERLGMKKIKETEHDSSTVYELELYPPKFKTFSHKLKDLYNIYITRFERLGE